MRESRVRSVRQRVCHEGSVVPGGRAVPSLARGGCAGVGCVKAVPYKGNKKVWKNQINADFFLNGKYYILQYYM